MVKKSSNGEEQGGYQRERLGQEGKGRKHEGSEKITVLKKKSLAEGDKKMSEQDP